MKKVESTDQATLSQRKTQRPLRLKKTMNRINHNRREHREKNLCTLLNVFCGKNKKNINNE